MNSWQKTLSEISAAHPGVDVSSQLTDGTAAAVLLSESTHAEVTVVGSRGMGGFAGLLLGSVSAQVAAHGHGTVVVVRPSTDPEGPVLVGYDGSAGSVSALAFGVQEALDRKVPLIVAHVYWEDQDIRHPAPANPAMAAASTAEQLLNDAVELPMEQHPELEVKTLPIHSRNADHALVEESARAGLTVVGCRGRGGFAGLLWARSAAPWCTTRPAQLPSSTRANTERSDVMKARAGDRLVLEGIHVGDSRRVGIVLDVPHADGSPPYTVRWLDNRHDALVFPGSEARVEPPTADRLTHEKEEK